MFTKTIEDKKKELLEKLGDFSKYLQDQGLKITTQRVEVARKVFAMEDHFTVEHLTHRLNSPTSKNAISRATIYRIVSVMVGAGLLIEHNFGQNAKFYEHTRKSGHHDHLICLDCGFISEFYDKKIEDTQVQVASNLGFDLSEHSLIMYAKCRSFKEKGACKNKK